MESNEIHKETFHKLDHRYSKEFERKFRIVGIFSDFQQMPLTVQTYQQTIFGLANREDLRAGIVKNKQLASRLKRKYGKKFSSPTRNFLVMFKAHSDEFEVLSLDDK